MSLLPVFGPSQLPLCQVINSDIIKEIWEIQITQSEAAHPSNCLLLQIITPWLKFGSAQTYP